MGKWKEKITGEDIFKEKNKCKGKFVINKLTNKTCGDGFNERVYKILDQGDGDCLHSELYKEKVPLRSCGYSEKCEKDLDCISNRCNDGLCDFELECNETILSGCSYDSCLALNEDLDKSLYYWQGNKCQANPCNENTYKRCDEGGCNDLSYRFKYNKRLRTCEEIINEDGEETSGLNTMKGVFNIYINEGKYDNICKDVDEDKETCEVSPDLQPRYYCREDYEKENEGIDGDSNHCYPISEWIINNEYTFNPNMCSTSDNLSPIPGCPGGNKIGISNNDNSNNCTTLTANTSYESLNQDFDICVHKTEKCPAQ